MWFVWHVCGDIVKHVLLKTQVAKEIALTDILGRAFNKHSSLIRFGIL